MIFVQNYLDKAVAEENIGSLLGASYRNFHAKGLDYVCLHRSPEYTIKAYFLDGDVTKVPEVVNPHDHRYAFKTTVFAGAMADHRFTRGEGDVYQAFDYMTPLNGGNGFTFRGEERLSIAESTFLPVRAQLSTRATHLHTIQMLSNQTVLLLEQFADEVPMDSPTSTWVRNGQPAPDTSGLYDRFTADQFRSRVEIIRILNEAMAAPS